MNRESKIFVAGGTGMVGTALIKRLLSAGFTNIISSYFNRQPQAPLSSALTFVNLDLTRQTEAESFFAKEEPEYVFLAAAKVGGILANSTYKADFIYENIMIASNVIHAAYRFGVRKLINLGSSCIYPRLAPQPMKEEHLLTGPLEPTNEPYAIAKISAIKLCRYYNEQYGTDFISLMPTNLYGPHDNFDLMNSHVLPAMIRKFHEAKHTGKQGGAVVRLWGSGKAQREFLHVSDFAEACLFLMERYTAEQIGEFVNVGAGSDLSIKDLSEMIREVIGFEGTVEWDQTRPDGTPRKLLDISRIKALGWQPTTSLEDGIRATYEWYLKNMPDEVQR